MNKSQPSQQKLPIPQNPTNNIITNTITNDKNTKNNRTDIQPSNNNNKTMNKSQTNQQKPPIPQNSNNNNISNDKNTKNNHTDIQPSNNNNNNKTMNKSQPSQQKPQIPQKPINNTKNNRTEIKPNNNNSNNKVIWDCGSSLYDSVELDSFRKQIDSAIVNSARTLSMPRLPSENRRAPSPNLPQQSKKSSSSKFSRSFQKLLRSVFRVSKSDKKAGNSGNSSPDPWFFDEEKDGKKVEGGGKYIIVYDKPEVVNGLTTIPEVPEVNFSPEIGSNLVRKTMSERFTSASFGIHCV